MTDRAALSARISEEAHRFLAARTTATRIDLITRRWPDINLSDAQAIAYETVKLTGSPTVGYKLGYTSEAMRRQMGISTPNFGWLTAATDFSSGCSARLVHPRIEPEVAVVLGKDLKGGELSRAQVIAAMESVHASFEIVDTRYRDYTFTALDNTADNSSAAGFVLGPPCSPADCISNPLKVSLECGGAVIDAGLTTAALGGPVDAVLWLAKTLSLRGAGIPAGSIILTGGLTAAPRLEPNQPVRANFESLGAVNFVWAG